MGDAVKTVGGVADNVLGTNIAGDNSTDKAINAQNRAASDANATARYVFDTQRADNQPWRDAGVKALGDLGNADFQRDFKMEDYQQDPGYQFRMAEGSKALERSAAARGGLNSGATLKALTKYGQDFASNEYQNAYSRFNADRDRRFSRLSSLAGVGQNAVAQMGQAAGQYGQSVGSNQIGMGNAVASAEIAKANRSGQMLQQGSSAAMMAFSDERLKTDVTPVSKSELAEMKKHLKAYSFKYVSPEYGHGDWVGVMAQDLEKSKLGKTLVVEDANGLKQIDIRKVMSLFLATMAEG